MESFNGRLRGECLNEHPFLSLGDAWQKVEVWRLDYHRRRPHRSLGCQTSEEVQRSFTKQPGPVGLS